MFKNKIEKNWKIFRIVFFLQHRIEVRGPVKEELHKTWQRGAGEPPLLLCVSKICAGGQNVDMCFSKSLQILF